MCRYFCPCVIPGCVGTSARVLFPVLENEARCNLSDRENEARCNLSGWENVHRCDLSGWENVHRCDLADREIGGVGTVLSVFGCLRVIPRLSTICTVLSRKD